MSKVKLRLDKIAKITDRVKKTKKPSKRSKQH